MVTPTSGRRCTTPSSWTARELVASGSKRTIRPPRRRSSRAWPGIRKGYLDASEQTRRELARRWREQLAASASQVGAATTVKFIERMAGGFGGLIRGAGEGGRVRCHCRVLEQRAAGQRAAACPAGRRGAARAVRRRRRSGNP